MTVANIITLLRKFVKVNDMSDVLLSTHITTYYKKLYNAIVSDVWENYFFTTSLIDAVANQESYTISKPTSSTASFSKITGVYIKDKNETTYKICRNVDLNNNTSSLSELLENSSEPSYFVTETELYILPKFTTTSTESGANEQIKISGINSPIDLETTSLETDILIPADYHELLYVGALAEIYRFKKNINLKNDALQEFMQGKNQMVINLKGKETYNDRMLLPDDTALQS